MTTLAELIDTATRTKVESIARHTAKRHRDIIAKRIKRAQARAESEVMERIARLDREAEERLQARRDKFVIPRQGGGVIRPIR